MRLCWSVSFIYLLFFFFFERNMVVSECANYYITITFNERIVSDVEITFLWFFRFLYAMFLSCYSGYRSLCILINNIKDLIYCDANRLLVGSCWLVFFSFLTKLIIIYNFDFASISANIFWIIWIECIYINQSLL